MTGEIADKQHHKRNQPQAVHDIRQQIARDIRRIRAHKPLKGDGQRRKQVIEHVHENVHPNVAGTHIQKRHYKARRKHHGQGLNAVMRHAEDQCGEDHRRPVTPAAHDGRRHAAERKFLRHRRDEHDRNEHRQRLHGRHRQKICRVCVAVQPRALQKLRDEVCGNVHQNANGKARKDEQNTVQHTVFLHKHRVRELSFPKEQKKRERQHNG